ncbi:hypothetical protein X975_05556, partial [Stegodyphus mimosarum]
MGFSFVNELSKPDKAMSTGRWKKMVSTGNIKCPEKCVPPFESCFTFVITKSANSMTVVAYLLLDPKNFNANFYYNLTDLKSEMNREGKNENKLTSLQVPYLSPPLFQLLIRKIKMQRKSFHPKDKNESYSSSTELHGLLSNILKTFEKNLPIWELFRKANSCDVIYDELDPSDWPERVHLLQKQMHMEEIQKNLPMSKLLALGSKLNQHSVSFSSEDMEKYFKSTGEAKDVAADSVSLLRDMTQRLKHDFETICKEKWPEILNCSYDDI